jgi:hypothetical protein
MMSEEAEGEGLNLLILQEVHVEKNIHGTCTEVGRE